MEVAQRALGRAVFDGVPRPRRAGWVIGTLRGKQHDMAQSREMPKGIMAQGDAQAQMQSCGESCSVGQGADTATKAGCRFHVCWKRSQPQTIVWIMVLHTSVAWLK